MTTESTTEEPAWHSYGTHFARFEPPDVVVFRAVGDISVDDARLFWSDLMKWPKPEGGFFYMADMTQMGHQSGQVLDELRKLPQDILRATAAVGGKFPQRVAAGLFQRVMRRLKLPGHEMEVRFFATEAEARAWFDSLRAAV